MRDAMNNMNNKQGEHRAPDAMPACRQETSKTQNSTESKVLLRQSRVDDQFFLQDLDHE